MSNSIYKTVVYVDQHRLERCYNTNGELLFGTLYAPDGEKHKSMHYHILFNGKRINLESSTDKIVNDIREVLKKSNTSGKQENSYWVGHKDGYDTGFREGIQKAYDVLGRIPFDPKDKRDTVEESKY